MTMRKELHNMKSDKITEKSFKIIIVGNKNRFFHLNQFAEELEKRGIHVKIVHDIDFLQKKIEIFSSNPKSSTLHPISLT